MTLSPFPVPNAGAALALLSLARANALRASYHPSGGTDRTHDKPVTHTVWVMGSDAAICKLIKEYTQ